MEVLNTNRIMSESDDKPNSVINTEKLFGIKCPFSVAGCWADRDARDRILAGVPGADGPHPTRGNHRH